MKSRAQQFLDAMEAKDASLLPPPITREDTFYHALVTRDTTGLVPITGEERYLLAIEAFLGTGGDTGGGSNANLSVVDNFDAPESPFELVNGAIPWIRDTESLSPLGKKGYMRAGNSGIDSSTSEATINVVVPTGTSYSQFRIDWYVGSESSDSFIIHYNNAQELLQSYVRNGIYTKTLSPGTHAFKVSFVKDGSVHQDGDIALISRLELIIN